MRGRRRRGRGGGEEGRRGRRGGEEGRRERGGGGGEEGERRRGGGEEGERRRGRRGRRGGRGEGGGHSSTCLIMSNRRGPKPVRHERSWRLYPICLKLIAKLQLAS